MAVTTLARQGLPQWSAGSDPPINRAQANAAFLQLDAHTAGWLTPDIAANRPAASAANIGFLFRATDTGAVSLSTGAAWLNMPTGTYLATSGGALTGFLDLATNELRNVTVLQARDKGFAANITGAAVIDAANGPSQILTLTGNVTGITVNNLNDRESLYLTLIEDATGSRTIVFPAGWIWPGGFALQGPFKTTANAKNVVTITKVGSDVHAFMAADMKA